MMAVAEISGGTVFNQRVVVGTTVVSVDMGVEAGTISVGVGDAVTGHAVRVAIGSSSPSDPAGPATASTKSNEYLSTVGMGLIVHEPGTRHLKLIASAAGQGVTIMAW